MRILLKRKILNKIQKNKGKIITTLRSHYPEVLGIRKSLQRIKVKRIFRHTLSEEEIVKCEDDPNYKNEIVKQYLKQWEVYMHPTVNELDRIISNSPKYWGCDVDLIRNDMLASIRKRR
jgi:hypothetical protein